jgi:hypothetical protein
MGFVVDKVALGQVFSEYFGSPCQFSFHRLLHTHHLLSGADTIGQLVADVPSGLSLNPHWSFISHFMNIHSNNHGYSSGKFTLIPLIFNNFHQIIGNLI